MSDSLPVQTILISVTDKTGLKEFIEGLQSINPDLRCIATDGSYAHLQQTANHLHKVSDVTNFPECFGGRVKTLHPKLFGGILYRRGQEDTEAEKLEVPRIDMILCNLYDFESASQNEEATIDDLMQQMDIGGCALIRSACKNHAFVGIVTDSADYPMILEELHSHQGQLTLPLRQQLALRAINITANYDALIAQELSRRLSNEFHFRPRYTRAEQLRYGENPDQRAWVMPLSGNRGKLPFEILGGKTLSYNNYEDATLACKALHLFKELNHPTCGTAIIKHGGICGLATGTCASGSFQAAWEGDPVSAFGSVIGLTHPLTYHDLSLIENRFIEVIIAPDFDAELVDWCHQHKKNLRLLKFSPSHTPDFQFKNIEGGMLIQSAQKYQLDLNFIFSPPEDNEKKIGIVTDAQPPHEMLGLFQFALLSLGLVKSNALTLSREYQKGCYQVVGVGGGQPNRVDCLKRLAIPRALEFMERQKGNDETMSRTKELNECVLASDGFFPFSDSIEIAAEYGVRYFIQPGGSVRDQEIIDRANALHQCMIFTGQRYFTH